MFGRFRGAVVSLGILASVAIGTVAYGHVGGTHVTPHIHHFNYAGSDTLHQHWNGCYKHVTYQHVDSVDHKDANGNLVQHDWLDPVADHLHESYYNFYSC